MKIVALHTDFRIYWPARLKALNDSLESQNATLDVIEIAGKGSPYVFSNSQENKMLNWHILFPQCGPEQLKGKHIRKKLFNLLNKINPDVIIAGAIAFPSGALAVQWALHNSRRVIVFDDAKIDSVPRNRIINYVKQSIYDNVDAMLYPAPDWIKTGLFWGFNKFQMFWGVDVVDNSFWQQAQSLTQDLGDYFVSIGRQIPKKNFLTITEAYAKYVDKVGKDSAYNLVMIGEGPEHNRLIDFVKSVNLEEKVSFLPFMQQSELPAIYQHAKALCIASDNQETWGLVINEAMAAGCPIIASKQCGATNTLVQENKNGYTFSCEDTDKLTEHMYSIHRLSPDELRSMQQCSKMIISDWNLDRFVKGCINAIDYVSSNCKRHSPKLKHLITMSWNGQYKPV